MPLPRDLDTPEGTLAVLLARAARRLRAQHLLHAVVVGLIAAAAVGAIGRAMRLQSWLVALIVAVVATAGTAAYLFYRRPLRTRRAAARALERLDPSLRNLVVTAEELLARPEITRSYMRERVFCEAAMRARPLDPRRVARLRADAVGALAAVAIFVSALAVRMPVGTTFARVTSTLRGTGVAGPLVRPGDLTIDIRPPQYMARPPVHLRNPDAVEAVAGSQATVRIASANRESGSIAVRLNGVGLVPRPDGSIEATLAESGYLAIDTGAVHRLLPLTVTPDRPPDVKINAPARDLRLPSATTAIPIEAEAADDFGLRALELHYTIVSGTGEQLAFREGTLPASVTRASVRSWRLSARLSLADMKLEPGDALVYRAIASDQRPGEGGEASSDTFFVEIAGPGDEALTAVDMPPDKERYALSEQMIVMKIERLKTRERQMAPGALVDAADNIAAEQRSVRANFIFLLGGAIEDEEVEAQQSTEIQEGRFVNRARQEIVGATLLMSRVEQALSTPSTAVALPLARDAVLALQRAFGHSRYLLRALPAREGIDPSRRLLGDLTTASDWTRTPASASSNRSTGAARAALAELLGVASALDDPSRRGAVDARLARLAEQVLAVGPGTSDLEPAARDILAAKERLSRGQMAPARAALQRAAALLLARSQQGRIDGHIDPAEPARLQGAAALLTDASKAGSTAGGRSGGRQ